MFRNKSVDVHQFAMIPRADIPRAAFDIEFAHKTTFDAGYLIPFYVDEVLPGDSFKLSATMFARLATPLFPVMDNMYLDSFFFFVPNRLIWTDWVHMMGQQENPGDSISFVVPTMTSPVGGYVEGSLQDYMGLPTAGTGGVAGGNTVTHASLHLRAYNKIYNDWFRDENLQNSVTVDTGAGPDTYSNYVLLRRGKRRDYFTSCLPWPQKGATAVTLPLGTSAPVYGDGKVMSLSDGTQKGAMYQTGSSSINYATSGIGGAIGGGPGSAANNSHTIGLISKADAGVNSSGLYADLSSATAATINQLRQSFQIQKLLERDARGGTRYTELLTSHFGVTSPDARLQRSEYLGGGSQAVNISPIAQTGQTGLTGGTTPLGTLGGMGTVVAQGHGFTASFVEHGVLIGLVMVRADLTYQQGMRKMWSRSTRYDFYWPAFAMLGEQAVLNQEIYCDGSGSSGNDGGVFGYQERWAEYRYHPSTITGYFRSTNATPIDGWHLAQKFASLPSLNSTFIQETPPVSRVVAVGAAANGQQFIFDSLCSIRAVRCMPLYSVPGLIDHF